MNFIEAIKSGRRFRHKLWRGDRDEWADPKILMSDLTVKLTMPVGALIADDWELKPEMDAITISRKKYSDSWHRATIDLKIYDVSPSVLRTFRDFIARELGFEHY